MKKQQVKKKTILVIEDERPLLKVVNDKLKKSGYDADAIKTNLYATKDWQGAIGKLTIDENGDPILGYLVKQVKDGKLVDNK